MSFTGALRGLLAYGFIWYLYSYVFYFYRLDKEVRSGASTPFSHEITYAKLVRIQEKIMYGKVLSRQQRDAIKDLRSTLPQSTIQGILLGRYLTSSGNIVFHQRIEWPLTILTTLLIIFSSVWLIGVGIEVAMLETVSVSLRAKILVTFIMIVVIPVGLLAYITISPVVSYQEYRRVVAKRGHSEM